MGRALQRYKKLFEDVKKDDGRRIYFLYGPEDFLKKEFVAELIKLRLFEGNRAFNLDIFYGDEFDRDAFLDRLGSFPLFTNRRLVILKNFEGLSASNQDFVLDHIEEIPASLILVVETTSPKPDTARLKKLQQIADRLGLSFSFQHLSDDETLERVRSRLEREGYHIAPEALELLVNSVGTHLTDLANEVEKIVLSTDQGSLIGREQVAAVVGKYRTESLFALLDRMGEEGAAGLVSTMHRLIDGGEEPVFVLAMLMRRVIQLFHVRLVLDETKASAKSIGQHLGGAVSPFQVSILLEQARGFDTEALEVYLTNLRWADYRIKSTGVEPRHLLETAIIASAERKTLAQSNG
jgi:DNA polymerase-3 subunit delta